MSVEKSIEGMEMAGVKSGLIIRKVFQFIEKFGKSAFKIIFVGGIGFIIGIFVGIGGGMKSEGSKK